MPRPCEAEGHYRAKIVDFGLKEFESKAVAVSLRAHLLARLNEEGEWDDISRSEIEATGEVWVVKKDGTINDIGVQALANHAGWDADLASIAEQTWMPLPCLVTVKANEYKGETTFKIAFVNSWEWTPRGMSNISKKRALELQEKYGSALRAFKSDRPVQHPAEWESQTIGRDDVGTMHWPSGTVDPGEEEIPF